MKDLFIMLPLGLGDSLICNGLIREKAKEYETVYVPCWTHNLPSVKFMLSDTNVIVQEVGSPNEIFIQQVQHEASGNVEILKLGTYNGQSHREPESFDQAIYRQAQVDFSRRWDGFKLPVVKKPLTTPQTPFALVCDSVERGFNIEGARLPKDISLIRPWKAHSIFEFTPLISEASEIHCINSAFAILIDSVPTPKAKLFMHRYARPFTSYDNFKLRKPWKILT